MGELFYSAALCVAMFGGEVEVREYYALSEDKSYISADCITDTHFIEMGLDARRSSFDSVHQAAFGAHQTGKLPMVVIIDTNGIEDVEQYQIETVARSLDIEYRTYTKDFALRLAMTRYLRERKPRALALN